MDHLEAVRSQSAEKYLLGVLDEKARDDFEEHFFECVVCGEDVRTGLLLMDNAAAEFRDTPRLRHHSEAAPKNARESTSWRDWFPFGWRHPAFAIPALALLAVSALWVSDHERLRSEFRAATEPQVFTSVPLDVQRGAAPAVVTRDAQYFAASFYIDPDTLPVYAIEISGNGTTPVTVIAPQRQGSKSYNILLPTARYKRGRYEFTIKGGPGTDGHLITRFPLTLE